METINNIDFQDFTCSVKVFKAGKAIVEGSKRYDTLTDARQAAERWSANVLGKYGKKKASFNERRTYGAFKSCECRMGQIYATYDIYGNKSVNEAWLTICEIKAIVFYTITNRREVSFTKKFAMGDYHTCDIPPIHSATELSVKDIKKHILKYA
jgi:hypothetical protein